jgi:NADH:ubiquinone oxidoreductase subunit C
MNGLKEPWTGNNLIKQCRSNQKDFSASFFVLQYLLFVIPRFVYKAVFYKSNSILYVSPSSLIPCLTFLKQHTFLSFDILVDLFVSDYPDRINRFELTYILASSSYAHRFFVKLEVSDFFPVNSSGAIFKASTWLEREAWDLFGVFFSNAFDLRRILTDYGFNGFPLRKDFPLSGFVELRYDDERRLVCYEPLELSQDFRSFEFRKVWAN